MPITEKQRQQRRGFIGSSDAAAILGADAYRTAYDVWAEKTGRLAPQADGDNAAAGLGNVLERSLLDMGAARLGLRIRKNVRKVHPNKIMAASLDAYSETVTNSCCWRRVALECKTTGLTGPAPHRDQWGEEGSADVPEHVLIQCCHQMACARLDAVHVVALIGGMGFRTYLLERDEAVISSLTSRLCDWWHSHVIADMPPSDSVPSWDVAQRMRRQPASRVALPSVAVSTFRQAREARLIAEKLEDAAKAALLAALGDAEAGDSDAGTVTFLPSVSHRFDSATFKELHPDLWAEFQREQTSRRLYVK